MIRYLILLGVFIVFFPPSDALGNGVTEARRLINTFGAEQEKILYDTLYRLSEKKRAPLRKVIERLREEREGILRDIRGVKWSEVSIRKQALKAKRLVNHYMSFHIAILNEALKKLTIEEGRRGVEKALTASLQEKEKALKRMEVVYKQEREIERMGKRRGLIRPLPVEKEPGKAKGLMER